MLMLSGVLAFAQNRVVTGTVTDNNGNSIPGATVRVKGARAGTAADANGNFSLSVPSNATIVISGVGLTQQEIAVGNQSTVNVTMVRSGTELTGVVVTGFGIRRAPRELGYSTATISNTELNQAKPINPVSGLTGKVSGLDIQTTDNGVNPAIRVTLRGNRSILGNNQALFIVDGNQVDNAYVARLNPNDIESTNVLKGAAASAIYGSNAANGVIIITTKRGTKGKPRIGFSSTVQAETISYLPNLQNRFGSYGGEDYSDPLGVVFPTDPIHVYFPYENQSYGPEYNGQLAPLGGPVRVYRADGTFYDTTKLVPYAAVKNGKRDFFDKGITLQNNINFSSGDETSTIFFSLQNVTTKGIVPGDKSDRNQFRLNGMKQYGKFKIDYTTSYSLENINVAGGSYTQDRPVYWTVINSPAHANLRDYRDWRNDPFANPNGYFNAYYGNPWWQIDEARNVTKNHTFIGSINLGLQITNWLNASYQLGYSRNDQDFKATKGGFEFSPYAQSDPWSAGASPSSIHKLDPSLQDQVAYTSRITGTALLTANKSFGDISTKLILGNTVYKRQSRAIFDATSTLVVPGLYNIAYRQGEPTVSENYIAEGLVGAFADLTLGYKNFFFIHASGRNDWNSKLAKENRSFFYPGVDASFVFTDAIPGLKNNKILNYGKVRAAWTKVGQVSVNPYALDNIVTNGAGFPYGSTVGFSISNNFANPGLKPEFTTEKEIGLELGFLQSRINFKAALYDTKTTNQTIPAQISAATGFTSATINLGSMTNKGIELDLVLTPLLNLGPVKWNFGANFAYNKNRVGQDLGGEISLTNSVYATPGLPYPNLKTNDWKRDSLQGSRGDNGYWKPGTGPIIVDAKTGFPSLTSNLPSWGTTVAPYKIGLTTSFNYKWLTLSAVADARFGAVVYNSIGQSLDFTGISQYSAAAGRQPFVLPNSVIDNGSGKYVPNTNVVTSTFATNGEWRFWANTWSRAGSPYVNSADFWKIREISLAFEFPKSLTQRLKIVQGASLILSGRNLFMFRPKDNVWTDPEFSDAGTGTGSTLNAIGSNSIYETPPTRIWGATLNINF